MKLKVQLEDDGHIYELDLAKLFKLLKVNLTQDEVISKVVQEINKS